MNSSLKRSLPGNVPWQIAIDMILTCLLQVQAEAAQKLKSIPVEAKGVKASSAPKPALIGAAVAVGVGALLSPKTKVASVNCPYHPSQRLRRL